jgi:multiple sugar transport system permease protein
MAAPQAAVAGAAGAQAPGRLARIWAADGAGYMFLLPWLIGFLVLTLGPALISLYLSFTNFDLLRPPTWVGADNYERIFTADAKFMASMETARRVTKLRGRAIPIAPGAAPRTAERPGKPRNPV